MSAAPDAPQPFRALTSYLPRLALEWLDEQPAQQHQAVDGTLAFVDISGFTKLTERLARVGRMGSEEISDLLEQTFGALLEAARADGADLVKWAGDAVLLLFRGSDHAMHAARAAVRMRQVLREVGNTHASAGQVRLRMSVGIHSGRFHFFLVGDPGIHRELIVSSPGASITAEMEKIANAGQIAVSDATAELLPGSCIGSAVPGGRLLRSAPTVGDTAIREIAEVTTDPAILLAPPLRAHLRDAAGESEHRQIAVAFVEFSDTDALIDEDGIPAAVAALDECVRNVQAACAAHDVSFLESDIAPDGGKFMLAAGAPRSSGDDDDRLLRAIELVISRQGRLPLRAGINHGRVFAGDFGPSFRRTYSIKGDAVNVAARVMSRADLGTTLATTEVIARSRTVFATEPVAPFSVKGKKKPIEAVILGAPRNEQPASVTESSGDAFVGRESELSILHDAAERARSGRGSLVDVVAEPGMGKSRLIEELMHAEGDLRVVRGPSASYESKTPYYPFRVLLREVLGLQTDDDAAAASMQLGERVNVETPHLLPWLPLLGLVVGADFASTRETDELDERFRAAKLEEVLLEFLTLSLPTPSLLIFENTQLSDGASAELLGKLETSLDDRPWLVVATRRDIATGFVPTGEGSHYQHLPLAPIAGHEALSLLESATHDAPLSAAEMEVIAAKAGGNPLFLRALVAAARHASSEDELPDSVEAVLTSELDRLPSDARTLLRYASVLGVEFSEQTLREMVTAQSGEAIQVDLDRLARFVRPEGHGRWRFGHALVREVAYGGLPYRRRRLMHQQAGRALEASTANPEEVSERLSMHFFHATDYEQAWTYSRMAGLRAKAQYAHGSAIEFFERAVESGKACKAEPAELADVYEALGDVRDLVGASREAVAAYRRARPFRRGNSLQRAELLLKEAGLQQRMGGVVTSFRLLAYARSILREGDGAEVEATRSRLATRYSFGKYLREDYRAALRWSEIGVREAELSGDQEALAYAYNTRHLACIHAGVDEEMAYGELALAAYTEAGDLRMQGHCLNNLAISALHEGRWDLSAELLDQAEGIFQRVGDTANVANAQYNRADLLIRQRRFAEAEPLLYAAERAAWVADDRELVALTTREAGRARAGLGHPNDAMERFEVARAIFAELGLDYELIGVDEAMADCLVALGEVEQAIELASAAIARANEMEVSPALASLHRVRGYALLAADRPADARAAFEAGLQSPDSGDGRRDYALNLLGLAALPEQRHGSTAEQLRDESRQILSTLGVMTGSAPQ